MWGPAVSTTIWRLALYGDYFLLPERDQVSVTLVGCNHKAIVLLPSFRIWGTHARVPGMFPTPLGLGCESSQLCGLQLPMYARLKHRAMDSYSIAIFISSVLKDANKLKLLIITINVVMWLISNTVARFDFGKEKKEEENNSRLKFLQTFQNHTQ